MAINWKNSNCTSRKSWNKWKFSDQKKEEFGANF